MISERQQPVVLIGAVQICRFVGAEYVFKQTLNQPPQYRSKDYRSLVDQQTRHTTSHLLKSNEALYIQKSLEALAEHRALQQGIRQLFPNHQIRQLSSRFVTSDYIPDELKITLSKLPGSFGVSMYGSGPATYPQDIVTHIGPFNFLKKYVPRRVPNTFRSRLADGGRVLTRNQLLVTTPEIVSSSRQQIANLETLGYRILQITPPDTNIFAPASHTVGHLDGHLSLLEDPITHSLHTIAISQFTQQNDQARRQFDQLTSHTQVHLIDQDDLPHLGLNLIQNQVGQILANGTRKGHPRFFDLLDTIVGRQNIIHIDPPLSLIPEFTRAAQRCMHQVIPQEIADYLTNLIQ